MARKYRLTTLGCKVNQYQSQQLRELLASLGYRPAQRGETPDITLVNTCAVTASATRKNRQTVRRESRNGVTPVFVLGCGATADADRLRGL
jgi:threonylcarbamoyladenosine tRNA methylthiotransferase MtaB